MKENVEMLQSVMKYDSSCVFTIISEDSEDLHNDGEWNILCKTF